MPLTLRLEKGSALTYSEMDGNFTYLSSSIQYIDTSSFAIITGPNTFDGTQTINGSLKHGGGNNIYGQSSHAEGESSTAGIQAYYSNDVLNGIIIITSYGNVTSYFTTDSYLILDDTDYDDNYGTVKLQVSQSYVDSGNTVIELYDTTINTTTAVIGSFTYNILPGADYSIGNNSHAEGSAKTMGYFSHAEGLDAKIGRAHV